MRCWCPVPVLLLLTTAAAAQPVPPQHADQRRAEQPPVRIWRAPPGPVLDGRLGLPLASGMQVGVGRFAVPEPARPPTHTEPITRSADIARRHRGIAAVGLSLRF